MKPKTTLLALTFIIGMPALMGVSAGILIGGIFADFPRSAFMMIVPRAWKWILMGAIISAPLAALYLTARKSDK
jgi:hypothetical protein